MEQEEIDYLLNPASNENEPQNEYKARRRVLKAALKLYTQNKVTNERTSYLDYVILYIKQQKEINS